MFSYVKFSVANVVHIACGVPKICFLRIEKSFMKQNLHDLNVYFYYKGGILAKMMFKRHLFANLIWQK